MSIPVPRRTWTDAEWDQLRRGAAGADWVATLLGDRLSLARAVTGQTIYGARLRRELPGWKIVSAEVESDPQIYRPDSEAKESEHLQSILELLVS